MVYAFDFDGTVDDKRLQDFAIKLRQQKNEVWVVTMRRDNEFNNNKLKPVLNKLGLSKYSVIFCDEKPKFEYLKGIGADVYIDNITDEFETIKNHTNIIPLLWS
jgi:hypothetical protein